MERTVECGKLAAAVVRSIDELGRAADDAIDAEDFGEFTAAVEKEVEELQESTGDAEVAAAAESVLDALDEIAQAAENDTEPDLSPLGDAADELTAICSPG
ncbi:hypothetical protein PJ985_18355 [Streptomyces sp. ACA25]|uniref:hypothetical protein n=1 Tax=Streptomyces sp. ACA25 TaxID=3022596 RepID=UPI002307C620|nr:hypothetical protein [Streptomyces sp. ACA25]MDB1089525.1 hypothetical protein [Streptomyces sp. ACA25]